MAKSKGAKVTKVTAAPVAPGNGDEAFVQVPDLVKVYPLLKDSWFYTKAEAGELPSYKAGKYRLFKLSEVRAWFEGTRQGPRQSA
jgi:hypothetical protein